MRPPQGLTPIAWIGIAGGMSFGFVNLVGVGSQGTERVVVGIVAWLVVAAIPTLFAAGRRRWSTHGRRQ